MKRARPCKHVRRVKTKNGRKSVVVNRKIKKLRGRKSQRVVRNFGGAPAKLLRLEGVFGQDELQRRFRDATERMDGSSAGAVEAGRLLLQPVAQLYVADRPKSGVRSERESEMAYELAKSVPGLLGPMDYAYASEHAYSPTVRSMAKQDYHASRQSFGSSPVNVTALLKKGMSWDDIRAAEAFKAQKEVERRAGKGVLHKRVRLSPAERRLEAHEGIIHQLRFAERTGDAEAISSLKEQLKTF